MYCPDGCAKDVAAASLAVGASRENRSRYRPDPMAAPEWVVMSIGAIAGALVVVAAQQGVPGIILQTSPALWPTLPLLPALGVLVGLVPAWLSPPPPLRALEGATSPADTAARDVRRRPTGPENRRPEEHRPENIPNRNIRSAS